jgi:hypothetical protein
MKLHRQCRFHKWNKVKAGPATPSHEMAGGTGRRRFMTESGAYVDMAANKRAEALAPWRSWPNLPNNRYC